MMAKTYPGDDSIQFPAVSLPVSCDKWITDENPREIITRIAKRITIWIHEILSIALSSIAVW